MRGKYKTKVLTINVPSRKKMVLVNETLKPWLQISHAFMGIQTGPLLSSMLPLSRTDFKDVLWNKKCRLSESVSTPPLVKLLHTDEMFYLLFIFGWILNVCSVIKIAFFLSISNLSRIGCARQFEAKFARMSHYNFSSSVPTCCVIMSS